MQNGIGKQKSFESFLEEFSAIRDKKEQLSYLKTVSADFVVPNYERFAINRDPSVRKYAARQVL